MSEKQLENLRKGREARAEKMRGKKAPPPKAPEVIEEEPVEEEPVEEEVPEPAPKPKRKLSEKQLDALRRARESKASKALPKKKPPTMTTKRVQTTVFEDLAVFLKCSSRSFSTANTPISRMIRANRSIGSRTHWKNPRATFSRSMCSVHGFPY